MSARDDTNDSTSSTNGACGMPRALVGEVLLPCQLVEGNRRGGVGNTLLLLPSPLVSLADCGWW